MSKYAMDFDGYKIKFSGVAYVRASSVEEAEEKFDAGDFDYREANIDSMEQVDEMIMDL